MTILRIALHSAALAVLAAASPLTAQRDLSAGYSARTLELDPSVDAPTELPRGIAYLPRTDEIFVVAKSTQGIFKAYSASTGALLRTLPQPLQVSASAEGLRDGATDGNNLAFATEFGIILVDENGALVTEWLSDNAPTPGAGVTVANGVIVPAILGLLSGGIRGLTYDPSGNGGDGSFWVGSDNSDLYEIDLQGQTVNTLPSVGALIQGLALDPVTGNLWVDSDGSRNLLEVDAATGLPTGGRMNTIGGFGGGVEIIAGTVLRGPTASGVDILHLQRAPDRLYGRRLHLDAAGVGFSTTDRLGTLEPDAVMTTDEALNFPFSDRELLTYNAVTSTLDFDMDIRRNPGDGQGVGGLNGTFSVFFANLNADAAIDATSGLLREITHLNSNGVTLPPATVPPRSFSLVMSNDPLNPSAISVQLPPTPFQGVGDCVRLQGVYLDEDVDFLPLATTNQFRWCRVPDPIALDGTYFEAVGTNSFNSDPSTGFFSLTNLETDPDLSVVSLTVTWLASEAQLASGMRFDTDNPNMADNFMGGDSLSFGCFGTYRNNSDLDAGLIYAGTPQQNVGSPFLCDPSAQQGWVGTDLVDGIEGDFHTLTFRFAPTSLFNGVVFEWDCDTDQGLGSMGGDMAGLLVEIQFADGSVRSGTLVTDPAVPERAFVQL